MFAPLNNKFGRLVVLLGSILSITACFEKSDSHNSDFNSPYDLIRVFPTIAFNKPVAMLAHPSTKNIWYVVEQAGVVVEIDMSDTHLTQSVLIDISNQVDASKSESGLLSMAFHPKFQQNGYIFLSYTRKGEAGFPLTSYVSRFKSPDNGKTLDANSESPVLKLNQPYSNHNGGQIDFDQSGNLIIGFGDGGSGGDPQKYAQNPQSLLGKILRIDVDAESPYAIPKDNPFISDNRFKAEIYALGFRNPWRWSFDRSSGELWVGDVGQNEWEEIDVVIAGGNYGWNIAEGKHCYLSEGCDTSATQMPIIEYSHDEGCSVTGGMVYRGAKIAGFQGTYIFGDFCSGKIWGLVQNQDDQFEKKLLLNSGLNISSFARGLDDELYVIHYGGEIYQITAKTN